LNPKIIKSKDKIPEISKMLREFYLERPDNYVLMDREQIHYDNYADIIKKYCTKSEISILDVGSGSHRIPLTIAEKVKDFKSIISIDYYSEAKLKEFRSRIENKKIELVTYESEVFPFKEDSFDVVSSLCVFEHILNVDFTLNQIKKVLKPGGTVIIVCPNWSGIHAVVHAFLSILLKKNRYWRYEKLTDAAAGYFRVISWYLKNLFSGSPGFILIEPRIKNNKIDFERSDDDAVHLCQPLSFKKWFRKNGFRVLHYNRFNGESGFAKLFNTIFPSFSTTNLIVAQKNSNNT
jgi:ubiquinone/menaquinone biosynthesis C-methylase UbiE